jgi:hypothetical protein
VLAEELLAGGCNLDRKNANARPDIEHLPPWKLVESILKMERRMAEIIEEIRQLLGGGYLFSASSPLPAALGVRQPADS